MQYRSLGKSGLKVSALSLGAWVTFGEQIDENTAYEIMKTAFDSGVNFFDNAEGYAAGRGEEVIGRIIKKAGWKRSDLVLSTKIFWGGKGPNDEGLSRKHIVEGTNAALKRLQTDYVDLLFCHRPDLHTPIEETVWAMNLLIQQGKALYWGTSEWSAEQIWRAYHIARREHLIPPQMEQSQYNMFVRQKIEKDFKSLYDEIGLGTTIFSPLASGFLSGKYNEGMPKDTRATLKGYEWLLARLESPEGKERIAKTRQLSKIADELSVPMAQLALAWCLLNPNVSTVITGASRLDQLEQNLKSLEVIPKLTKDIVERIERVLMNKPELEPDLRENG